MIGQCIINRLVPHRCKLNCMGRIPVGKVVWNGCHCMHVSARQKHQTRRERVFGIWIYRDETHGHSMIQTDLNARGYGAGVGLSNFDRSMRHCHMPCLGRYTRRVGIFLYILRNFRQSYSLSCAILQGSFILCSHLHHLTHRDIEILSASVCLQYVQGIASRRSQGIVF